MNKKTQRRVHVITNTACVIHFPFYFSFHKNVISVENRSLTSLTFSRENFLLQWTLASRRRKASPAEGAAILRRSLSLAPSKPASSFPSAESAATWRMAATHDESELALRFTLLLFLSTSLQRWIYTTSFFSVFHFRFTWFRVSFFSLLHVLNARAKSELLFDGFDAWIEVHFLYFMSMTWNFIILLALSFRR